MNTVLYLSIFLASYLIGSVTFAVVFAKLWGYPDPRTRGSKNAGATNMLRVSSRSVAFLTLLCDALKGVLVVVMALYLAMPAEWALLAGFLAFLGHLYPLYYAFQGGKGVATGMGVVLAFSPLLALYAIAIWLVVYLATSIVSLASIVVLWSVSLLAYFYYGAIVSGILLSMAGFVTFAHRSNIVKIWSGIEPKTVLFGRSKNEGES